MLYIDTVHYYKPQAINHRMEISAIVRFIKLLFKAQVKTDAIYVRLGVRVQSTRPMSKQMETNSK